MIKFNNSWDLILQAEWNKPYYIELKKTLIKEYETQTIYPKMQNIFDALKYVSFETCKVVILGQDPYHGENQAHGLSFSVQPQTPVPPSLKNIFKEINSDISNPHPQTNGNLVRWTKQGVLLLNAVLTVRKNLPTSHAKIGWQNFTDNIIKILNISQKPIVFLLWGSHAIKKRDLITNQNHLILTATHPSPLSASRGFFGCKHFSKTNQFLQKTNQSPILW